MDDPFAAGLDTLFRGPCSAAAIYGDDQPIRVIRHQPTSDLPLGDTTIPVSIDTAMIRRSEVGRPARGERLRIGSFATVTDSDPVYRIAGEPRLDVEALTWTCELEPLR